MVRSTTPQFPPGCNEETGQALVPTLGTQSSFYVADRQAVQAWIDAVLAQYGRIDVLVNFFKMDKLVSRPALLR